MNRPIILTFFLSLSFPSLSLKLSGHLNWKHIVRVFLCYFLSFSLSSFQCRQKNSLSSENLCFQHQKHFLSLSIMMMRIRDDIGLELFQGRDRTTQNYSLRKGCNEEKEYLSLSLSLLIDRDERLRKGARNMEKRRKEKISVDGFEVLGVESTYWRQCGNIVKKVDREAKKNSEDWVRRERVN